MSKLYFKEDDEMCYPLSYFKWLLDYENLEELTLYEAQRQDVPDYFWCREHQLPIEKSKGGCGKVCEFYKPKNSKSGCCKHYSLKFYEPTDKVLTIRK
jgi:hypothetical protein